MRFLKSLMVLSAVVALGACNRNYPPPDKLDVSWMDTLQFQTTPVASPLETGLVAEEVEEEAATAKPVVRQASAAPRRTTARSTSSGTYRTPAPAPAPRTETVRHTARDAAIGAGAGAVIGAVAGGSRHRVKGAVIGAAAGAVLGGVIGHTVDKSERVIRP